MLKIVAMGTLGREETLVSHSRRVGLLGIRKTAIQQLFNNLLNNYLTTAFP